MAKSALMTLTLKQYLYQRKSSSNIGLLVDLVSSQRRQAVIDVLGVQETVVEFLVMLEAPGSQNLF